MSPEMLLPYGDTLLPVNVPARNLIGVIRPTLPSTESYSDRELIHQALQHPIGTPPLHQMVHPGQKVAIITSDLTRPCPSSLLLPPLLDELARGGVADEDVLVVIGLGLHRPMSEAEIAQAVGPQVRQRVRVVNHDPEDTVFLGTTSHGTPVGFFRPVVQADFRIGVGNLELHWFAGFSGGAKALLPGVASRATISANHALMTQPGVGAGRILGNPLRMDIEEGAAMLGLDFILNVVVGEEQRILGVVAGDMIQAHRQGCSLILARGAVPVSQKADIVIASAGGFPKDINMYQAHKAMEHGSYFVRAGGVLILVAECREGWGNAVFETWMKSAASPEEILTRFQEQFCLGGHKAARIVETLRHAQVFLITSMPDEEVRRMYLRPFPTPQAALEAALAELGSHSRVLVLPHAGSVIPRWE